MAMRGGAAATADDALDFLVIGTMKAGTTSLFEYLREHPEIDLPPDKEVPYFNDDRLYESLAWEEYVRQAFPTPKRGQISGTITPQYLSPITLTSDPPAQGELAGSGYDSFELPRRIHERLPSARLIAILRDPVQRAYSHHAEATRRGNETRSFAVAVDELLQPDTLALTRSRLVRAGTYVAIGEYGRLLEGYYDLFGRERILVLFTEELAGEPRKVLRRIYDFLGIAPDFEPPNLGKRYNVGSTERRIRLDLPATVMRVASGNRVGRAMWHSLSSERRSAVLGAHRRFSFRYKDWNRRGGTLAKQPSAEDSTALERLRAHFVEDGRLLEKLLGQAPPWASRNAAEPG